MGLGKLIGRALGRDDETRNLKYEVTNTLSGTRADFTIITDGSPGMFPDWQKGEYQGGMGIPAAWRLALLAANQVGRTPWHSFRQVTGKPAEKLEPQPNLLAYPMGTEEPALNVWRSMALDRIWHGNAVSVVAARSPLGYPTVVLPIDAQSVAVDRFGSDPVTGYNPPPPGFRAGEKGYLIGGRWYHADEVIHWCGPKRPGALRGMGVLENHFQTLSRSQALDTAASAVTSAGVPTGLLTSLNPDLTQTEAEELKAGWLRSQRTRSVAVLNPSTTFTPIAWNPTETQLLESRQYSVSDWANIFELPATYAGGQNSSRVYANIVDQGMDILRYGLVGNLVAEFEALMTAMLPRGQYVKGNLDHLLRADTKGRYEAHAIALSAKFLTADEVRELEEKPPLTEEQKKAIQEAQAPPPAPGQGAAGPQPARPTAASNSAGSGSARPRLAAVRAVGIVGRLIEQWRYDEAMAAMEIIRDFRAWQVRTAAFSIWQARGYPEFNQHQPRYPKGNGQYSGRWTDRPGGRAPYGAKSGFGTWPKGKWTGWDPGGEHVFGGQGKLSADTKAQANELAAVGSAVTATKPMPAKAASGKIDYTKQSKAEAEFDAFVEEMDVNPTKIAYKKKVTPKTPVADADAAFEDMTAAEKAAAEAEFDDFLGSLQDDIAEATGDTPATTINTSGTAKSVNELLAGPEGGAVMPDFKITDAADSVDVALHLGVSKPPWGKAKDWSADQWSTYWNAALDGASISEGVKAANGNGSIYADGDPAAPKPGTFAPKAPELTQPEANAGNDADEWVSSFDSSPAASVDKAEPGQEYTQDQWIKFFEPDPGTEGQAVPDFVPKDAMQAELIADQLGVPVPNATISETWTAPQWEAYWKASHTDGKKMGSAMAAAMNADPEKNAAMDAAAKAAINTPPPPPAPVLDKVPADLAELEATAAQLGVGIPPKGVGSLSWSGEQWSKYWEASKAGDTPAVAATKANGVAVGGTKTYSGDWNKPQLGGPPKAVAVNYYGSKTSRANKAAEEWNKQVGGAVPQWEAAAAKTYSGSTYTPINEHLWGKTPTDNPMILANIENIDNLMKKWKAPKPMVAIRGLDVDPAMPDPPAVGKTYASKGYQSTSVGSGAFSDKKVIMKINVPKGMNGIVMNGGNLSYFPHEEELLLPHNTRYVVTKDEMKGGKRWLEVNALPPE